MSNYTAELFLRQERERVEDEIRDLQYRVKWIRIVKRISMSHPPSPIFGRKRIRNHLKELAVEIRYKKSEIWLLKNKLSRIEFEMEKLT